MPHTADIVQIKKRLNEGAQKFTTLAQDVADTKDEAVAEAKANKKRWLWLFAISMVGLAIELIKGIVQWS